MNSQSAAERTSYYAHRERQERAVAERAVTDVARLIHLDLADRYASLARS